MNHGILCPSALAPLPRLRWFGNLLKLMGADPAFERER